MQKANRIQYIDALRGFTMLLVVYGHVCTKLFSESGGAKYFYTDSCIVPYALILLY